MDVTPADGYSARLTPLDKFAIHPDKNTINIDTKNSLKAL